ncbi:MAG: bifunctional phosphopantothenoylcysteine decarboxylase/phosphopantothenate--cysteine ligase CoaBC [Deltaproteobacteria bacterium]|nr:bifunctional phosphopantothenoylcysteine decarboxylase/phosphopantothenate--cysteine ligase CoaBC [Deltaproteobacteria bacterium]
MSGRRILLGVSGGIAAYKAPELVRRLQDGGHEVRCALSRSAESFVSPLALEVLTGHRVYRQEYLAPGVDGEELHITAAAWAEVLCFAPATAHLMARLALGLADDFLTTAALAFSGDTLIAPAMHHQMWSHPSVQHHLETLITRGTRVVGPETGPLASGEVGMGRLATPRAILEALSDLEAAVPLQGRTVLISAGPTREPVDPVRYLGNRSSGKMGFALAAEAAKRGARTILVAGPVHLPTPAGTERTDVTTAMEMEREIHRHAATADLIIMTAAVADFRVRQPQGEKIKKGSGVPVLDLVPNPDILRGLEAVAPQALRIGFAAETNDLEAHALEKLESKGAHGIVANDVSRQDIGFRSDDNEVILYLRDQTPTKISRRPKAEIAALLLDSFTESLLQMPLVSADPSS